MYEVIPSNTATASLRRMYFKLVDATDLFTPEDITVTGVKVSLSMAGAAPANSTNDIVKVAGSTGEYYLELTQTEANQTAGIIVRGTLTPTGCALSTLQAQIGPSDVFTISIATSASASSALSATTSAATQQSSNESATLSSVTLRPTSAQLSTAESTSLSSIALRATSAQASTTGSTVQSAGLSSATVQSTTDSTTLSTLTLRPTSAQLSAAESTSLSSIVLRATSAEVSTAASTAASVALSGTALTPSQVLSLATSANGIYAHTRQINGTAVQGNGTAGNKWRG